MLGVSAVDKVCEEAVKALTTSSESEWLGWIIGHLIKHLNQSVSLVIFTENSKSAAYIYKLIEKKKVKRIDKLLCIFLLHFSYCYPAILLWISWQTQLHFPGEQFCSTRGDCVHIWYNGSSLLWTEQSVHFFLFHLLPILVFQKETIMNSLCN